MDKTKIGLILKGENRKRERRGKERRRGRGGGEEEKKRRSQDQAKRYVFNLGSSVF